MKTKTKNRTPRRILAVFLSILMLMSSFVFASPVVSEAYNINDRVTFNEKGYGISGQFYSNTNSETVKYNSRYGKDYSESLGGNKTRTEKAAFTGLRVRISNAAGARTTAIYNGDPKRTSPYYNSPDSPYYLDFNFADKDYRNKPTTNGVYYGFFDKRLSNRSQPLINAEYSYNTEGGFRKEKDTSFGGSTSAGLTLTHYECVDWKVKRSRADSARNSTNGAVKSYEVHSYYEDAYSYTLEPNGEYWRGEQPKYYYKDAFLTSYEVGPKIFHYVVDSTALYNKYKELYVGYNEGYYTATPLNTFAKAMHAAEMVLNGKLDRTVVAPVADGGYGYQCICQELIDAILADLNSVTITVKFADILTARSDPADAATFNPISMPSNYRDGLNVSINASDKYDASNVKLVVNDKYGVKLGEYTPTGNSGSRYNFKVPITGDIAEIVATNFKVNQYKVSVPANRTGLEITGGGDKTVNWSDSYTFTVKVKDGYTRSTPTVKINGVDAPFTFDEATGVYTYTMENIKENKNVTIDNLSLNEYSVSYNLGEGIDKTADSAASVIHGNDATVAITIGDAYTQSKPQPVVNNGTLTYKSTSEDGKTFYYTLSGVTDDVTVTAPGLSKNTYKVALPTGEGYTAKVPDGVDLNSIVYGTDLSFSIDLDEQYNRSKVVVKYNGTVIEPVGKIYTIKNVTHNIGIDETDPVITVDGVELNHYYITLPLESESGFTIEVGEGLNAKSVLSGTDFNFKLFIDPAYSDSIPTIKVSRDGGDNYTVLSAQNGNEYIINGVLSDCIVVVENVKKNTYTVKFLDDEGNVDKAVTDVEYGSSVEYPGESEPTKANETISDKTVDGVRTVVEKKYTFIGWSQDTSNVTSNMEVSPIFEV